VLLYFHGFISSGRIFHLSRCLSILDWPPIGLPADRGSRVRRISRTQVPLLAVYTCGRADQHFSLAAAEAKLVRKLKKYRNLPKPEAKV
jgi:hypothetical protein